MQSCRQAAQNTGRWGEAGLPEEAPRSAAQDQQGERDIEFGKGDRPQEELQAKADAGSGAPVAVANRVQILPAASEPLRQPVAVRHQSAQRAVVRDQSVSWHEVTAQEQREYRQEEQQHYRKPRPA